MFGYITVNQQELKIKEYNRYRAYYCGLCKSLREAGQLFRSGTLPGSSMQKAQDSFQ